MRFAFSLLVSVIFFSSSLQAQYFSIGAKGGISIPNLTSNSSNPINSGYQSSLGPDAAVFGEYQVSHLFSVELSLEYSTQGGKKSGKQALPVPDWYAAQFPPGQAPSYLWANFDASAEFQYLLVPVLGKFGFDFGARNAWRAYVSAGPFVGFLLSAKSISKGTSNVYSDEAMTQPLTSAPVTFDSTMDIKNDLYHTNYGIEGNLGIAYGMGPHHVFLEVGGNYGFQELQKDPANGQNRAGAAVVRIGYYYTLGHIPAAQKKVKDPRVFN